MSTSFKKNYLFFIYLLVVISSFISGNDECPDEMRPLGKCINDLCPYESECILSQCCAYKTSNITTLLPNNTTNLPSTENEIDYCVDGTEAIGACLGQYCPPGYICLENVCCVDNTDSYEVEDELVNENVTQGYEIINYTENYSSEKLITESTLPVTTEIDNLIVTTEEMLTTTPEAVNNVIEKTIISKNVDIKINTTNHCPIGESIGECISGECPQNYECINGMCCKLSENINCKDVFTDCKKHLCEKEEYFEFLTLKCGRTCQRCHQQKFVKVKKVVSTKSSGKSKEKSKNTSVKKTKTRNLKCQDSRNDCEEWMREGFCYSPVYTLEQKKAICGVSCQLC
uniref:ShKT domain-containing protein n=2 Tax=Strongyloides papillosus TaxID=174720 RepID=A0A0N5B5U3_STREA